MKSDDRHIHEQFEESCRLEGKSTGEYVGRYHIIRGEGMLATIIASEHVAQQIVRAINLQSAFYFYLENIPKEKLAELEHTDSPGTAAKAEVVDLIHQLRTGTFFK